MNQTYTYTIEGLVQAAFITWILADWQRFLDATPPEKRPVGLAPENFVWDGRTLKVNQAWEIEFNESLYKWLADLCLTYDVSGISELPYDEDEIPYKYKIIGAAKRLINDIKGTCVYNPPLPQF